MPFKLTEDELQHGYDAIEHHGYSTLLPPPPEWEVVKANWAQIRAAVANLDLDEYKPATPLRLYAPKSRATVRVVTLLHPIDLLIYTSLTLIAKNDIEANRISVRSKRVFSYRVDVGAPTKLYGTTGTHSAFRERARTLAERDACRFVAVADIADFYPRIYQHRLENVIQSAAQSPRVRDVARVLVRKLLSNLAEKNSYGIPVGPYASRLLAEAVLIDADARLMSGNVQFVRWVDDYYIFCRSEIDAQRVLFQLAEHLFENHGLTLSALKTKILRPRIFKRQILRDVDEHIDNRLDVLATISARIDPYSDDPPDVTDDEVDELEAANIDTILTDVLRNNELIDYETVSAILRHPAILERLSHQSLLQIADTLLAHLDRLYPVSEEVSRFFALFANAATRTRNRIKGQLLKAMLPKRGVWPPDYFIVWMLSVLTASPNWGGDQRLLRIFAETRSNWVKRAAALALAVSGGRAEAITIKAEWSSASTMTRCAMLLASRKLGQDERHHWKTSLGLAGILEKLL